MRIKKIIIISSFCLSLLSCMSMFYMEFFVIGQFKGMDFLIGLMMTLFGSSFLILFVSIIEYYLIRRETLIRFYSKGHQVMNHFSRIKYFQIPNCVDVEIDHEKLKKILKEYVRLSKIDYYEFGNMYADIDFIFGNKIIRQGYYDNIYKPTMDMHAMIMKESFHFNLYLKGEANNHRAVLSSLSKLQKQLFRSTILVYEPYYRNSIYNEFVIQIRNKLENVRYKAYGNKKIILEADPILQSENKICSDK